MFALDPDILIPETTIKFNEAGVPKATTKIRGPNEKLIFAYIKLPRRLTRKLHAISQTHNVIGFMYSFNKGDRAFELILREKETI